MTDSGLSEAEYGEAVTADQLREAEHALGLSFPEPWRAYVQSGQWFRRGWLKSGAYVWLYSPTESVELMRAWGATAENRPGMIVIGGDGASELLTIDARKPAGPVTLTPNVSVGWQDSVEQTAAIAAFIAALKDGSFEFLFGDEDFE